MVQLPVEYVVSKFYELGYRPTYNKFNGVYQCACPICKEGKSFATKRRCYYIPKNDNIYCQNCGYSSKPLRWIKDVSGHDAQDIINESKEFDAVVDVDSQATHFIDLNESVEKTENYTLPTDCINLFDSLQREFYRGNKVYEAAIKLIKDRRLDTAVNRPDALYLSLKDKTHKNRLIIPFCNESGDIEFYQSRTIMKEGNDDLPRYLGKRCTKSLFNLDKIDPNSTHVYIFEGPLNAFFTRNSTAVAGITEKGSSLSQKQQHQLDTVLRFYDRTWVLDSQWVDNASLVKSEQLLKQGESVFIWPEKYGKKFKDFNDIAIHYQIDEIGRKFIQENTFKGLKGVVKLSGIKKAITP